MKKEDLLRLKTAFFKFARLEAWAKENECYNNPSFLCACIHDYLTPELEWLLFKRCYSAKYSFQSKWHVGQLWAMYGLVRLDGSVPRAVRKYFYWHARLYKEFFDDPEVNSWSEAIQKLDNASKP